MTISSELVYVERTGNDLATSFSFSFPIFSDTELLVTHIDDEGTETPLVLGSGTANYTVSVTTYPGSGAITYPASGSGTLATGAKLRIQRVTNATQLATLLNQGAYHPQTVERILDRNVALIQENKEAIGRSIKVSISSDEITDTEITVTSEDIGKAIVVNADGDGFELSEVGAAGPQGEAGPQGPQGASGAGSGDMLAAQNLSDVVDVPTAQQNLELEPGVDVQAYDATLAALAGLTIASNKIIKGTAADAFAMIDFLDEDAMTSDSASGVPSQQSVKAYVDAAVAASAASGTGDVIFTIRSTPRTGWVFMDGRSIGNASSGATNRANADTVDLFTDLWNSMADAQAPVSGGRGGSAAADFAANKRITLPDARDRVIAAKGNMSGSSANRLTNQSGGVEGDTLGVSGGAETHALTSAQNGPHTHTLSIRPAGPSTSSPGQGTGAANNANTASSGSGTAHNNVQPTIILNCMVKL